MLYIRFLNFQTPLQDVEKMYKDGAIKYGDIVCQQYNDKSSHLFMNGTWIKTLYNSKIKQNNEIEDDIEFLSTAIGNNSTNIGEDEETLAVIDKYNVRNVPVIILEGDNGDELKKWVGLVSLNDINAEVEKNK